MTGRQRAARVKLSDMGDDGLGTETRETCHDNQSLENEETGGCPDSGLTSIVFIITLDRDRVISMFFPLVTDMMILLCNFIPESK